MSDDKFQHTAHDLTLVQDWLDARGYSGEAKTVMDAMDLIATLRAELAAERERADKAEVWRGLYDGVVTVIKQLEAELAAERERHEESNENYMHLLIEARAELASVVEECAKVAEKNAEQCGPMYGDGFPAIECREIAKRIRALAKETKP